MFIPFIINTDIVCILYILTQTCRYIYIYNFFKLRTTYIITNYKETEYFFRCSFQEVINCKIRTNTVFMIAA